LEISDKEVVSLKHFEYFAPTDISGALRLMDAYGERAKLLAGGTDLLVQMKNNQINPSYLIDLKKIPELIGIHYTFNGGLRLCSLTTVSEVASSKVVVQNIPILSEAAKTIGSVQIRNRATVGGNVCRAAPSGDLLPVLLVLDAQLQTRCLETERNIEMQDFFVGPGKTILKDDEILMDIRIPNPPSLGMGAYLKYGLRQTMDLAIVGVAVFIVFEPISYACKHVKIALGSVAPIPLRAKEAEKILTGEKISQAIIEEAAKTASKETSPITDVYGPDWYKREVVAVLVKRAIMEVLNKMRGHKNET
jgi:carbon-monoxide dehydrogenase medium subunit